MSAAATKLVRDHAALLVVDVQEAFRKALADFDEIAAAAAVLARGAGELGLPVIATEQYPKGLGPTVEGVAAALPPATARLEKVRFSAAEAEGFDLGGRQQAIVCGIEAHVCVSQTVLDLLALGVEVHVVGDAVGSRTAENRRLGLERMERAGAVVTSVETALFELLGGSDAAEFKQVQALIK